MPRVVPTPGVVSQDMPYVGLHTISLHFTEFDFVEHDLARDQTQSVGVDILRVYKSLGKPITKMGLLRVILYYLNPIRVIGFRVSRGFRVSGFGVLGF
jgi:hypothetical protein